MAALDIGDYYIVSVDFLTSGALALNFNGENSVVTVTAFDQDAPADSQVWTVSEFDSDGATQLISPSSDDTLQIAKGDGVLTTITAGDYDWLISGGPSAFVVQDEDQTVFWDLAQSVDGEDVSFEATPLNCPTQYWQFVPVPS